jgi:DNA-binding LacI/PurR family transcriptional regulator
LLATLRVLTWSARSPLITAPIEPTRADDGRVARSSGASANRTSRAPTIIDVARSAGVSKSLVSRVMRGSGPVSSARARAVLAAAESLGYRPNAAARTLVQRRSYNIGVVVADLHKLYFAEVLDGVTALAKTNGYHVLMATGERKPDAEAEALERLLELRMDGVILISPAIPEEVVRSASQSVPVVVVNPANRVRSADLLYTDDEQGAGLVVGHLVSLGHRHIVHIDGGRAPRSAERRNGYLGAMRLLGLGNVARVVSGDPTDHGGYQATQALLSEQPRPTAIFAHCDLTAVGVLHALEDAGLAVPAAVSVVGYDDDPLPGLRGLSLTTVRHPRQELGEQAMKMLLSRFDKPSLRTRRVRLEPTLVARSTSGAPPS